MDGSLILPADDRLFGDLLVKAVSGRNVEDEVVALLNSRRPPASTDSTYAYNGGPN